MNDKAATIFEIPPPAVPYTVLFLTPEEICAVASMDGNSYSSDELCSLLAGVVAYPTDFVMNAYSRGVLSKIKGPDGVRFVAANFYTRLAYFAQYEPQLWQQIPPPVRAEIDLWYVEQYMEKARPRLEAALSGNGLIENAFFYTLEETLSLIDSLDFEPYMVPCNCKSVAMNCTKPREVCMLFGRGINSEWDRGHGVPLSKEEAKDLVRLADKNGLMHTSEEMDAICNCDGCCCYPIRASQKLGTKGVWPKQRYKIALDLHRCVGCGKCCGICNFGALRRDDAAKSVVFDEAACWGCTICASHCPRGAIAVVKIQ